MSGAYDELRLASGLYVTPGTAGAYPELKRIVGDIAADRVAQWPWVPSSWIGTYRNLQAGNPLDLVKPAPARGIIPAFCNSPEKVALWNQLAAKVEAAVALYAKGQADAGAVEMQRLYADVDFWNEGFGAKLIAAATAVRDLPANAVGAVLDGAGTVAGGLLKRIFSSWIVWVGIAGLAAYVAWRAGLLKVRKGK